MTEQQQEPNNATVGQSELTDLLGYCRLLPDTLIGEKGGGFGFVCIWRMPRDGSDTARRCTVGDFLSRNENIGGIWYIDGGWGGPPGPIRVDWDDSEKVWRNRGFPPHD